MQIKEEVLGLMRRDYFIRRGRNNRIYHKFISKEIFQDSNEETMDDHHHNTYGPA